MALLQLLAIALQLEKSSQKPSTRETGLHSKYFLLFLDSLEKQKRKDIIGLFTKHCYVAKDA